MKGREIAMLITIGVLLYVNVYLESETPTEYSPLPAVLVSASDSTTEEKEWKNAADTQITSEKAGTSRLRVRVELKGAAKNPTEHAAFLVNQESWIDGKDGWLYYRNMLKENETADPICLRGYLDRQGAKDKVYAALICEWESVDIPA